MAGGRFYDAQGIEADRERPRVMEPRRAGLLKTVSDERDPFDLGLARSELPGRMEDAVPLVGIGEKLARDAVDGDGVRGGDQEAERLGRSFSRTVSLHRNDRVEDREGRADARVDGDNHLGEEVLLVGEAEVPEGFPFSRDAPEEVLDAGCEAELAVGLELGDVDHDVGFEGCPRQLEGRTPVAGGDTNRLFQLHDIDSKVPGNHGHAGRAAHVAEGAESRRVADERPASNPQDFFGDGPDDFGVSRDTAFGRRGLEEVRLEEDPGAGFHERLDPAREGERPPHRNAHCIAVIGPALRKNHRRLHAEKYKDRGEKPSTLTLAHSLWYRAISPRHPGPA